MAGAAADDAVSVAVAEDDSSRELAGWMAAIPARAVVDRALEARFVLTPGDRPLVEAGDTVRPGDPLLERLRDRRIEEIAVPASSGSPDDESAEVTAGPATGRRWTPIAASRLRRHAATAEGELLAPAPGHRDRWRLITGDRRDIVEAPIAATVTDVVAGSEIVLRASGFALPGALAAGTPAHGPLELATDPFGELRPGGIDVGRAGSILVVGDRIDAEALTRARAMGVRGVVVASLSSKDLRDFQASERRQRASLHAAQPFGVIALDGAVRHAIAGPIVALLGRIAGRAVGLLTDPPALVFDAVETELPIIDPAWVRIRSGPSAGTEGRLVGPVTPYHVAPGVHGDAAPVVTVDGTVRMVPIGDLERFV